MKQFALASLGLFIPFTASAVEPIADTWTLGIKHKDFAIELPSKTEPVTVNTGNGSTSTFSSEDSSVGLPTAMAFTLTNNYSDYISAEAELALSKGTSNSGYSIHNFSSGIQWDENYESKVEHSISLLVKYRPLGKTPFRPYIGGGLNQTRFSSTYTLQANGAEVAQVKESYDSTGLIYGFGFDFFIWKTLAFNADFSFLPHMETKTDVITAGLTYSF